MWTVAELPYLEGDAAGTAAGKYVYPGIRDAKPVAQRYHFTSARKRMSTAVAGDGAGAAARLHCKGASEIVVRLCDKVMRPDGTVEPLAESELKEAESAIVAMAKRGLRTLCIAYSDLPYPADQLTDDAPPEESLTLLGVVGIKDPIRPETAEVRRCRLNTSG